VEVADIGLDTSSARAHLVERDDVAAWLPRRSADAHKWKAAVWVIAGSGGMFGAARLAAGAAQRAGSGMVWLSSPGAGVDPRAPTEAVNRPLRADGWAADVVESSRRFHALVVGPGMGRDEGTVDQIGELVGRSSLPIVVDGDGLYALATSRRGAAELLRSRSAPTVLTPHDGEYQLLAGQAVGADRFESARALAEATRSVVLLKGPATVVAAPGGRVYVVNTGDERLATAGTGDVLAGVVGALLAAGTPAFEAAAGGAWIHGQAAHHGPALGLIASDLVGLIPTVLSTL
jgi:NAD(P)H-hydrate epimerase